MSTESETRKYTKDELLRNLASPVLDPYDYKDISYTNGLLTQIVYKQGGAAGVTVATVDYGYTSGLLTSIAKS